VAYTAINTAWYTDPTPNPTHEVLLAEYDGQGVFGALELQLSVRPVAVPTPNFPPTQAQLPAGSDQAAGLHATPCGFIRIETDDYAQGETAKTRVLYADLSSGRFPIGAHNRARVYASVWGNSGGIALEAQAVILPSDGSGDWLRYTTPISLAAGANVDVPIPMGARYLELVDPNGVPGATSSINFSLTARVAATRNYAGNVMIPATSPLPISALGLDAADRFVRVVNNDGANANTAALVFWVS
jgi:hypothetical protein